MASVSKFFGLSVLLVPLGGCLKDHAPGGSELDDFGPSFTSVSSTTVFEGITSDLYTATAEARNGGSVAFSLGGGADQTMFRIDSGTGAVSFTGVPDFENPADSNGDNRYDVELRAEDSAGRSAFFNLTIVVTDVNEPPQFTSNAFDTIVENSNTQYQAEATDPEVDTLTFAISGGADQALFNIDPVRGYVRFNDVPDFDAPKDANSDNVYSLELTASDGKGLTARMNLDVRVTDRSQLQVGTSFPTPNANLGGVASTVVTGYLDDLEDGVVEIDDVSFVDVDSQFAFVPPADPARWSARTSVSAPLDRVFVSTESSDGNTDTTSIPVTNEALILHPDLIAVDAGGTEMLIADAAGLGALISVDLTDDTRTVIANVTTGTGPDILYPQAAVLDAASDRVLVLDPILNAILSLDLATGNRALISDADTGTGPTFGNRLNLTLDGANNRVLVVDTDLDAVIAVNLMSGDRYILSGPDAGSGPTLYYPTSIVLDVIGNRALVGDAALEALVAVDLVTGARSTIADAGTSAGINYPQSMALDGNAGRVLIADVNNLSLYSIDLATGAGTIISDAVTGAGPALTWIRSMAFDAARSRAFITDLAFDQILAIDLASGDRTPYAESKTGTGPSLRGSTTVALDMQGDRVLATEDNGDGAGLVWIDLQTANRAVLSDSGTGTGTDIDTPTGLALDLANDRALLLDNALDALLSVDLTSGDRTIVADAATGSGTVFSEPTATAFDSANNRALVVDEGLDALLAVEISSGDRTVLSDASTGNGPVLSSPTSVALDEAGNRAFVTDSDLDALISVELATGNRTIVSAAGTGSGPSFDGPQSVALDAANDRALVADGFVPSTLYWVDLASGDRSAVTDIAAGGPVLLDVPSIALDAANNRAFAVDKQIDGLVVIELDSGQRAIASR